MIIVVFQKSINEGGHNNNKCGRGANRFQKSPRLLMLGMSLNLGDDFESSECFWMLWMFLDVFRC